MARITSIPTIMAFREGILIFSQPGALPGPSLEELIGKVRELDMAQVHAALAAVERQRDQVRPALPAAHRRPGDRGQRPQNDERDYKSKGVPVRHVALLVAPRRRTILL